MTILGVVVHLPAEANLLVLGLVQLPIFLFFPNICSMKNTHVYSFMLLNIPNHFIEIHAVTIFLHCTVRSVTDARKSSRKRSRNIIAELVGRASVITAPTRRCRFLSEAGAHHLYASVKSVTVKGLGKVRGRMMMVGGSGMWASCDRCY